MAKYLIALGAVAIAALIWTMMPVESSRSPTAQGPIESAAESPTARSAIDTPTPTRARQPRLAKTAIAPRAGARPEPVLIDRPTKGHTMAMLPAPPSAPRFGRTPQMGMAELSLADLKHTVRRYYGNLPRGGPMPSNVAAEDLFSQATLRALNVPGESRITMLGEFQITDIKAFDTFLGRPDDEPTLLGVSIVTPDGQSLRDYIRLLP